MSNWSSTKISTLSPVTSVNGLTGSVSITSGDIGAASTSHTHAASDISSGTIATARLASGTANSTTYLRGDQTWATVSGGDTTYAVTLADVENTTTETTVAQFTIPANTWSDGQTVELQLATQALQASGAGVTWVGKIGGTGITERSSQTATIGNAAFQYRNVGTFRFFREGTAVTFTVISPQNAAGTYHHGTRYPFDNSGAMIGPINFMDLDASVDFTVNITITYKMQWGTANASTWVRMISTRAVKYSGGNA